MFRSSFILPDTLNRSVIGMRIKTKDTLVMNKMSREDHEAKEKKRALRRRERLNQQRRLRIKTHKNDIFVLSTSIAALLAFYIFIL